jgi:hypothetical protein
MPGPSGYAEVVRAHHRKTIAYLLATQPPCRETVAEEMLRVARNLRPVEVEDLPRLAPRGSWLLAVLLCEGDDTEAVASWAARLRPEDRDRVRFYYHPKADLATALAAWVKAGLGVPPAAAARDFAAFHKVVGKHLNDRVWQDHA